ncbi:MAG: YybH family protein [Leadbetterella sp.]
MTTKNETNKLLATDREWLKVAQANDAKKMTAFYDAEGFLIDGTKKIKGVVALESHWREQMRLPNFQLKWEVDGVEISENLASTHGSFEVINGGNRFQGIYVIIWKKQRNGDWKVLIDKP